MKAYDFHGKRNICGDRIREARLRARLSQSDLCRRLQLAGVIVERDVISRIENGGRFVADFEVVVSISPRRTQRRGRFGVCPPECSIFFGADY